MIIMYPDSFCYPYYRTDVVESIADSNKENYDEIDDEFINEETRQ